jgi:hypothetical protein
MATEELRKRPDAGRYAILSRHAPGEVRRVETAFVARPNIHMRDQPVRKPGDAHRRVEIHVPKQLTVRMGSGIDDATDCKPPPIPVRR